MGGASGSLQPARICQPWAVYCNQKGDCKQQWRHRCGYLFSDALINGQGLSGTTGDAWSIRGAQPPVRAGFTYHHRRRVAAHPGHPVQGGWSATVRGSSCREQSARPSLELMPIAAAFIGEYNVSVFYNPRAVRHRWA